MVGHDQVRILRDEEVAVQHDASPDERLHLLDERPGIDDDAAADDAAAAMQDARGDRLEHVLLPSIPSGILHRSEEHTSELQSRLHLVCRLLLEKKKRKRHQINSVDTASTVDTPE